ncbi:hypothetical protein [Massilia pseudoviolaceinigra]|uniref:hypothetical protein n=1 Tax=Massilia pseudoviolaceinigra TaxID=3057165 RepID=UPI0027965F89|nr:hypothetical protein [Massilia sp. CCM 9206]MDQ1920139.1 hypothetical protein [Massilia sp. CCM 9206]
MSPFKKSLVLLAVFLTGCAGPQLAPPMQARTAAQTHTILPTSVFTTTDGNTAFLDDAKTQLYTQNFGGGGVAVGVLLGPIGALANAAMVTETTKSDAGKMGNKINIKPRDLFAQAARETAFVLVEPGKGSPGRVNPYLLITKIDDKVLTLAAGMLIDHGEAPSVWRGKYLYQLPGKYTVDQLAALDDAQTSQIRASMESAYAQLIARVKADSAEQRASEDTIHLVSPFVTPRFETSQWGSLIKEESDHVWVRTPGAQLAILKENVRYTIQKP